MTVTYDYERPLTMVDVVVFTLKDKQLCVALHKRPNAPYASCFALPGGYVIMDRDADLESAARRVLEDKMKMTGFYLEQMATFSGRARDPRGWSMSVVFLALVPFAEIEKQGVADAFVPVADLPDLAFDHTRIVDSALLRLKGKGAYSTLPAALVGDVFTLVELQNAYEQVLGERLDQSSFRRKISELKLLAPASGQKRSGPGRPAKLWKLANPHHAFDRTLSTMSS